MGELSVLGTGGSSSPVVAASWASSGEGTASGRVQAAHDHGDGRRLQARASRAWPRGWPPPTGAGKLRAAAGRAVSSGSPSPPPSEPLVEALLAFAARCVLRFPAMCAGFREDSRGRPRLMELAAGRAALGPSRAAGGARGEGAGRVAAPSFLGGQQAAHSKSAHGKSPPLPSSASATTARRTALQLLGGRRASPPRTRLRFRTQPVVSNQAARSSPTKQTKVLATGWLNAHLNKYHNG